MSVPLLLRQQASHSNDSASTHLFSFHQHDQRTVVVRDCTVDSGTRCGPCETGTFMNRPNGMTKCFSCTSCDPGLGLLTRQRCSATSDSVCGVLDGFFCRTRSETGCSLAEKHSACQHGQRIKQPGTSRNDTVCEDCPGGSFSPDGVSLKTHK
uniref:TNFR-Cys domain-containing protein n=1 Tax=Nothobranchius furzeri TaxID=105023 RepID=A0A8C6LGR5_NOTFU